VADRVDAAVDAMKAAGAHAAVDRLLRQSAGQQL
jgi:hypothetical protein